MHATVDVKTGNDAEQPKVKIPFKVKLGRIVMKIKDKLITWKEKIKVIFKKASNKPTPVHPDMTYEIWKKGRDTHYKVLDLDRPEKDSDFDYQELREHYSNLSNIFVYKAQANPPGTTREKDADRIWDEIDTSFRILSNTKDRLIYNLRLDYEDRPGIRLVDILLLLLIAGLYAVVL